MSRLKRPIVQGDVEAMRAWIAALTCLIVILGWYIASGKIPGVVPGPPEAKIIPPSPHLAPNLAALSGVWESPEGGVLPSRLVVEQIEPTWASIVYFWGDDPTGNFRGGWKRVTARVFPDGKLRWGHPGKFTIEISEDGLSLVGKKEQAGNASTFTMRRTAPQHWTVTPVRPIPSSSRRAPLQISEPPSSSMNTRPEDP